MAGFYSCIVVLHILGIAMLLYKREICTDCSKCDLLFLFILRN